jgi:hypothetical protein
VKSAWAVPFVDVGGDVGKDDLGVRGGAAGLCGYLGMLEDTVDRVEGAF